MLIPTAQGGMCRLLHSCGQMRLALPFLPLQSEEGIQLELLKTDSYDDVSKALAAKLGLDHPLKLRFTGKQLGAFVDYTIPCSPTVCSRAVWE
jgi:hypothetical protein